MRSDQLGVVGSNINVGVLFGGRGLFTIVEVDIVVSNKVADGHIIETASVRLCVFRSLNGGSSPRTRGTIIKTISHRGKDMLLGICIRETKAWKAKLSLEVSSEAMRTRME